MLQQYVIPVILVAITAVVLHAVAAQVDMDLRQEDHVVQSTCVMTGDVSGKILLRQMSTGGPVSVKGELSGLSTGLHGFHIHEYGDASNGCVSMGGHFNPHFRSHGHPASEERHVGDLGNILADAQGVARIDMTDDRISLIGNLCVRGRGIVVHANADDLGRGGDPESKVTGNAGPRAGCCIIGLAAPDQTPQAQI